MSLSHNGLPIVSNGLELYLDAANTRSYPGSGTTWSDLSINARSATLINGPTYSSSNNGFIDFDGVNDVADAPSFNVPGTSISMFAWFKFNTIQSTEVGIIRKENMWQLGFNNPSTGRIRILLGTPNGWVEGNDFFISVPVVNTWYYFGFVYNNGTTTVYWNGSLIRTITGITGSIGSNASTIGIGNNSAAAGTRTPAHVSISKVKIYNTSLTAAQVLQNYNAHRRWYGL